MTLICTVRLVLCFLLGSFSFALAETPHIAAASDLKFALEEMAAAFRTDTQQNVQLSCGSSGNFYRQIEQGAPFTMFLSADEDFVTKLAAAGHALDQGTLYAIGRIVLFAPHGAPLTVDARMTDLRAALDDGRVQRFAIANPEHAPYGRAARQELAELRRDLQMPVVLVTHDFEEAVMLADRLTMLAHGHTLQTGAPVEVMTQPDTVEVARLVGLKNLFEAEVVTHCLEHQHTRLAWRGRELVAALQPRFTPGTAVAWTIPASHVLLHRSSSSSHGKRDNALVGTVAECLPLGERVAAVIHVDGRADTWLATTIPLHKARRQGLALGAYVSMSLLAEGIHLMPLPACSASGGQV